jgi:hypothetical protein
MVDPEMYTVFHMQAYAAAAVKLNAPAEQPAYQPTEADNYCVEVGGDGMRCKTGCTCGKVEQPSAPIPMVLHCPSCGVQHIDKSEHDPYPAFGPGMDQERWLNPPHRSHLCHGCGHIWRPADVATTGVAAVQTKGSADSPMVHPATEISIDLLTGAVTHTVDQPRAPSLSDQVKCKRCGGTGVVDDGEIDQYPNGAPYENGPVKCVKDCPACSQPAQRQETAEPVGVVDESDDGLFIEILHGDNGTSLRRGDYVYVAGQSVPAAPEAETLRQECAEIIDNLVESIERHGNYSAEATVTFLRQARQCLTEMSAALAQRHQDAEPVELSEDFKHLLAMMMLGFHCRETASYESARLVISEVLDEAIKFCKQALAQKGNTP